MPSAPVPERDVRHRQEFLYRMPATEQEQPNGHTRSHWSTNAAMNSGRGVGNGESVKLLQNGAHGTPGHRPLNGTMNVTMNALEQRAQIWAGGPLPAAYENVGIKATNCAQMVSPPMDVSPFRSPQQVHSVLADRFRGKDIVEIGTHRGDGMICFATQAKSAIALEMNPKDCAGLRERSTQFRADHASSAEVKVLCQKYQDGIADADVFTWWQEAPALSNSCLLKHLRAQLEIGKIRKGAEAVMLFDTQTADWIGDKRSWKAVQSLVSWSARIPFDERELCLSMTRGSKRIRPSVCRRAVGLFLAAAIPIERVPLTGLDGLGDLCVLPRQRG
jgi:hypothetical protein